LLLAFPCWAGGSRGLARADLRDPSALAPEDVQVTGELRYYRHIDPVTGLGAVSIHAGGKEIPLDFRQFKLDILLPSDIYTIKGHWSKERRFVVTEAHRAVRQPSPPRWLPDLQRS
jgi:hypothetical protein